MHRTLQILNELEQSGAMSRYAIGGAMGATFYIEPLLTFDLDIFVLLPRTKAGLLTPAELYDALRAKGYVEEDECVIIEGVPAQFLPAYNDLLGRRTVCCAIAAETCWCVKRTTERGPTAKRQIGNPSFSGMGAGGSRS